MNAWPEWIVKAAHQSKLDSRRASWQQTDALILAGWKWELPASADPEPWQWYWRRPPKRKMGKGRFFASTNQAYQALQRERAKEKQ